MEQTIHTPETYDFRKYDQIWRRVAPNLEPYPDLREPAVPAMAPLASGAAPRAGSDRRVHRGGAGRPADLSGIRPAGTGFRPGDDAGFGKRVGRSCPAADDGLLPHHWELLPPGGGQRTDFHR